MARSRCSSHNNIKNQAKQYNYQLPIPKHTSAGHEDLNGYVLKKVTSAEDGTNFIEVPFSMQIVNILQNLRREERKPITHCLIDQILMYHKNM